MGRSARKPNSGNSTEPRPRAELDGRIAHLCSLSEQGFAHVLAIFPLVEDAVKQATLDAYCSLAPAVHV